MKIFFQNMLASNQDVIHTKRGMQFPLINYQNFLWTKNQHAISLRMNKSSYLRMPTKLTPTGLNKVSPIQAFMASAEKRAIGNEIPYLKWLFVYSA
jgi:hypothetical protein